jgi:WD40 repeat protein
MSGTIRQWDLQIQTVASTLSGHSAPVFDLKWINSLYFVSASNDSSLIIWTYSTMSSYCTLAGHGRGVSSVDILADGRIASGSFDQTVKIWSMCTLSATLNLDNGQVNAVKLLGNANLAVASGNVISIWNVTSLGNVQNLTEHTNTVTQLETFTNGTFVSAALDGIISLPN